jgi:hypothetical protein
MNQPLSVSALAVGAGGPEFKSRCSDLASNPQRYAAFTGIAWLSLRVLEDGSRNESVSYASNSEKVARFGGLLFNIPS